MDAQSFAYWLHGYTEITNRQVPTETQWNIICDHLDLVFNKVTPNRVQPKDTSYCAPVSSEKICAPVAYPAITPACLSVTGTSMTGFQPQTLPFRSTSDFERLCGGDFKVISTTC